MTGLLGLPNLTGTIFGTVAPAAADIWDLHVHLGVTKEVSSFSIVLDNTNDKYGVGAKEDYTAYVEYDLDSKYTVTAHQITVEDLTRNEVAFIYRDFGVNYFSGDFEFDVEGQVKATSNGLATGYCWALTNLLQSLNVIDGVSGDFLAVSFQEEDGDVEWRIYLTECDGGTLYEDYYICSADTTYYLTIKRDESVGTYGTLYCYIYSDSARTTLVDTLTLTLHTSKKDFRYLHAAQSYGGGIHNVFDGVYANLGLIRPISLFDAARIDLGRGTSHPQIFTGKVEKIEYIDRAEEYEYSSIVKISGRCNGWQLFAKKYSGDLIADAGSGLAGTIVAYLIDNYTSLSHDRSGELIEDSSTTYIKLVYDEPTTIWEILRFICETADDSGVIGYEMRIEYDGKFRFFAKNSISESYDLDAEVQLENYTKLIEKVKNKITIKGRADKPFPLASDGTPGYDGWTDLAVPQVKTTVNKDSAAAQPVLWVADKDVFTLEKEILIGWTTVREEAVEIVGKGASNGDEYLQVTPDLTYEHTAVQADLVVQEQTWFIARGGGSIAAESTIKRVGSRSVKTIPGFATSEIAFWTGTDNKVDTTLYPEFKVLIRVTGASAEVGLRLYDSTGKDAFRALGTIDDDGYFHDFTVRCDEDYGEEWDIDSGFDWSDIWVIGITDELGTATMYIDYMYFTGKRWGGGTDNSTVDGFAEDTTSQTSYGIREYFEINENFLSEAECEARADWSTTAPLAGNKTGVDMTPINVDADYRIDEMDIHVNMKDKTLGVDYVLSATPSRLADYLYRQQRKIKELSLTRSSKRRKR